MKISLKQQILIGCCLLFLATGCARLTNTELLTSDTWKLTDLSSDDADPDILMFNEIFLSQADFDYFDDGTFSIAFSDTSITAEGGTWQFINDESQLVQQQNGLPADTLDILTLDEETLEYMYTDDTGTYTAVFGH